MVLPDPTDLKTKYERNKGIPLRSGIFSHFLDDFTVIPDSNARIFAVSEFRDWIDRDVRRANGTFDESRSRNLFAMGLTVLADVRNGAICDSCMVGYGPIIAQSVAQ